jgi:cob(I)alamin adenosyltransferase
MYLKKLSIFIYIKVEKMVKLNKIYTRTGDDGETGLGDGSRIPKHSARVTAYGDIDELNAAIGVVITAIPINNSNQSMVTTLKKVQNQLFDLGADLCVAPDANEKEGQRLRVPPSYTKELEINIDTLNKNLTPLTSFVLPGGEKESALLHQARTIARRAERSITALNATEVVNYHVLTYINRLSDLLFVMARAANAQGELGDILWKPGEGLESD